MPVHTNSAIFGSFIHSQYRAQARAIFDRERVTRTAAAYIGELLHAAKPVGSSWCPNNRKEYLEYLNRAFSMHTVAMVANGLQKFYVLVPGGISMADFFINQKTFLEHTIGLVMAIISSIRDKSISKFFTFANRSRISLVQESLLTRMCADPASEAVPARDSSSAIEEGIEPENVNALGTEDSLLYVALPASKIAAKDSDRAASPASKIASKDGNPAASKDSNPGASQDSYPTTPHDSDSESDRAADSDSAVIRPTAAPDAGPSTGQDSSNRSSDARISESNSSHEESSGSEHGAPPYTVLDESAPLPEIIQIDLKGPDLRSAWLAHEISRSVSLPNADFTPRQYSDYGVYYAMNPGLDLHKMQHALRHGQRRDWNDRNDLVPQPCVETSFYAIRPLLGAVFAACICEIRLSPHQADILNQEFEVGAKLYRGVLLFQHWYITPSLRDPVLTTVSLAGRTIEGWSAIARYHFQTLSVRDFWNRHDITQLHGGCAPPDVIHAPEVQSTKSCLAAWIRPRLCRLPLWRTAHVTDLATRALHDRLDVVYAIAYEQQAVTQGEAKTRQQKKFGKFPMRFWKRFIDRA